MPGGRSWDECIARYGQSHRHPINRMCHTLGIPLILLSLAILLASLLVDHLRVVGVALFALGWLFQFVGHAGEGKPPEFFHDWRFLFVGVRWWLAKMRGRA